MHNRFLEMEIDLKGAKAPRSRAQQKSARSMSTSFSNYVRPFAAADRALVVLIENGGIDLNVQPLVDALLAATPLGTLLPESMRTTLADFIREKIRSLTDQLLESAELALNRYSGAKPDLFGDVSVLRDGTSSYDDLKSKLITLSRAGKIIDLLVLTHGNDNLIAVRGGIDRTKIVAMRTENGAPLSLRSVYMMNCVGAALNQAWLDAGAKTSAGSIRNNYLPEPTTYFFWQNWKEGQSFESAVSSAYRRTVNLLNEALRGFVRTLPLPGTSLIADAINVEELDLVRDSAPVIQGQRTVTINSDDLSFTQSVASSLATTVLPVKQLSNLSVSRAASLGSQQGVSQQRYSYRCPSALVRPMSGEYAYAQNPAAAVVAGISIADAAQVGLGAIAVVQSQVAASQGTFTLSYDRAQRLLTTEARLNMPGAQATKQSYSRHLFYLAVGRVGTATADIIIEWEGNAYGEIGTPNVRRNLPSSTEWSHSSANITISKVDRIPVPNTDPRAWPITYVYEGSYDPVGNGYYELSGEFEINAFGGLKFNRHEVVSRAAADFAIFAAPEECVIKGNDVIVPTPAIPPEQMSYVRSRLP